MPKLVFDIEAVGEDFDSIDEETQKILTHRIKKEAKDEEEYERLFNDLKNELVFSPLTSEVVAIGILDCEKGKSVVCYQAPGEDPQEFEEDGVKYKIMTEKKMLENFWNGAKNYDEFISFNGRTFDVPFLMVRSAIHDVKPSKDLMRGRYLYQQAPNARHIDLFDQLTYYGALRKKGGLHLWTRAFGIKSPKAGGISGEDVGPLFRQGKFKEIARYNVGDLDATKELYEYWEKYLEF